MHTWRQSRGEWVFPAGADGGIVVAQGYSGAGRGKNNSDYQSVPDVGPIPCGQWSIVGPPIDTDTHGPYVLRLLPSVDTNTFGRDAFLIHGDSKTAPGAASKGCIILPRPIRERIWLSNDRLLTVV